MRAWRKAVAAGLVCLLAAGLLSTKAANVAVATTQRVLVDGKAVEFETYALLDSRGYQTNYAKLRDVAYALNGTPAQFQVDWSEEAGTAVTTQTAYDPDGSEMHTPYAGDRAYQALGETTAVDGKALAIAAIRLFDDEGSGYTYYQLRDLGRYLGFQVDWSAQKGVFIETDKVYGGFPRPTAADKLAAEQMVGSWTGTVEITGMLKEAVDQQALDIAGYVTLRSITVDIDLRTLADGTADITVSPASTQAATAALKQDLIAGAVAYARAQAKERGMTLEQVLSLAGITQQRLEEEFAADMDRTMAGYDLAGLLARQGQYAFGADRLWLDDGEERTSFGYVFSGDQLKLTDGTGRSILLRRK